MITFVPAGGLGNRMKSIAAAIRLAKAVDDELERACRAGRCVCCGTA